MEDIDEELHAAGGIGAYQWGSLTLETARIAPTQGRAVIEALAGASAGAFAHPSEARQRGTLAVLHELVHYQQDLATGLGAYDHLATHVAWRPDRTVGLRLLSEPWWPDVEDVLPTLGIVPGSGLADYSLRSMFESEAAVNVWLTLRRGQFESASAEWLDTHQSLWRIGELAEPYRVALNQVIEVSTGEEEFTPTEAHLVLWCDVLAFLVDLSCAYPVSAAGLDRRLFNPVLRFLCYLRAVRRMDGSDYFAMWEHLRELRWSAAEEILGRWTAVDYPPAMQVYAEWIELLAPFAESDTWDAPLFAARRKALSARTDGAVQKGIFAVPAGGYPVQILVAGLGIEGIVQNDQLLEPGKFITALLTRVEELGVWRLRAEARPLRCPWGRALVCDAALARCSTGLSSLRETPLTGCRVRAEWGTG